MASTEEYGDREPSGKRVSRQEKATTPSAPEQQTVAGQRILPNARRQINKEIPSVWPSLAPKYSPPKPKSMAARTRDVDDTNSAEVTANGAQMRNGFKVVTNHAYQRKRSIHRRELVVAPTTTMEYKKLFTRFEEAFSHQDLVAIAKCLSPAFRWSKPNGATFFGKKDALAEMERAFATPNGPRFSEVVWRFKDSTVIQTYDVEYLGADGKWRHSKGLDIYEIGDGLITVKDAFWKTIR